MVVVVRVTSLPPITSVSPIPASSSPPWNAFSTENTDVFRLKRRQADACSTTVISTVWLPPEYNIFITQQTVVRVPCSSTVTITVSPSHPKIEAPTLQVESPPPETNDQQNEGPPHVPGDISQGKLSGIIVGIVLAVIFVVVVLFCWGNRKLIRAGISRGPGDDDSLELEDPPRRPNGDGGGGGDAPPEAPAPAEPAAPAPEPAVEPDVAPVPDAPPPAEPAPEAAAADPPATQELALHADAAQVPGTFPTPNPSPESSDDEGYVYPRRRRRSSSGSRVRFSDEVEVIPIERRARDV